jgi:HEAT repeat protein
MRTTHVLLALALSSAPTAAQPVAVTYRGRALSAYTDAASSRDTVVRAAALRAIGQFGTDGLPAMQVVISGLDAAEADVRQAAGETLAIFGPDAVAAVPALARLVSDSNPRTRVIAALALREIGPGAKAALPVLIAALRDDDLVVRMTVGLAIGTFGTYAKPAVRALMEAGNDRPDDWVSVPLRDMRRAMVWALGEIGPDAKEALPLIREWSKFYRVAWVSGPAIAKIEGTPRPATYR